ncbi:MAG: hypothetical protein QG551_60 [Patescibacteria group bacterium]|jgi:hypothetical protein|nr:hypothetical protein [Patescibacteria group bacterium]
MDVLPIFITIAGFIVGLGAVTVIDIHGFLARKSHYWTEATIRSHKVTKPLIWIGIFLVLVGTIFLFQSGYISESQLITRLLLIIVLIVNGCFLSFNISPKLLKQERDGNSDKLLTKKMQKNITISFLISFFGWWSLVLLFALHIFTS